MLPEELREYLNIEEGLGRVRGNRALYKTLLNTFVKNNFYGQLLQEMDEGDLPGAARTAHAIKGVAGNLSLPVLYQASLRLEQGLKAGEPSQESILNMNDVVEKTMQAVAKAVESL